MESAYCMPVLQIFDLWAKQVNECDVDAVGGSFGSDVIGEIGGVEYTLSYEDESKNTVLSLMMADAASTPTVHTLYKSDVPESVGYAGPNGDATCLTSSGGCVANTTLCVYAHGGDFNKDNDFGKEFPLVNEVIEFVAREACGANDGMLELIPGRGNERAKKHACACVVTGEGDTSVDFGGAFCMDGLNDDGTFKAPSSAPDADEALHVEISNAAELQNDVSDSPQTQSNTLVAASEKSPDHVANDSVSPTELPKGEANNPQEQNEPIAPASSPETLLNSGVTESAARSELPEQDYAQKQNESVSALASTSETSLDPVAAACCSFGAARARGGLHAENKRTNSRAGIHFRNIIGPNGDRAGCSFGSARSRGGLRAENKRICQRAGIYFRNIIELSGDRVGYSFGTARSRGGLHAETK